LRSVLGDGVEQKGSLVAPTKLRFDFSHKSAITPAELSQIEEKSTAYIRQNCQVYSQDVPLATARAINGVRAVFGETYPDPVRVVSVGVPVSDLLAKPAHPEWRNISVEFCGGTHVAKTSDIKDLVVLEESGIAKGIRRIIAVTGEDAHAAQRLADEFATRLTALENMPLSAAKEQRVKSTQTELNELSISTLSKSAFRDRFAKIHKQVLEAQKAKQKAEGKTAIDALTEVLETKENEGKRVHVLRLPIGANAKAVSGAINQVLNKHKEKTVYVFAPDEAQDGKVVHGCHVSEVRSTPSSSPEAV
jgi:alanyl-tRNA synthetase